MKDHTLCCYGHKIRYLKNHLKHLLHQVTTIAFDGKKKKLPVGK